VHFIPIVYYPLADIAVVNSLIIYYFNVDPVWKFINAFTLEESTMHIFSTILSRRIIYPLFKATSVSKDTIVLSLLNGLLGIALFETVFIMVFVFVTKACLNSPLALIFPA